MKIRNIIIATLVFIAIGVYAFYFDPKIRTTEEKALKASMIFDLLPTDHFQKITCQNAVLKIDFEKKQWKTSREYMVTEPLERLLDTAEPLES